MPLQTWIGHLEEHLRNSAIHFYNYWQTADTLATFIIPFITYWLNTDMRERVLRWVCGSERCAWWRDGAAADTRGTPEKSEHKHTWVTNMLKHYHHLFLEGWLLYDILLDKKRQLVNVFLNIMTMDMRCYHKILGISYKDLVNNEEVCAKIQGPLQHRYLRLHKQLLKNSLISS